MFAGSYSDGVPMNGNTIPEFIPAHTLRGTERLHEIPIGTVIFVDEGRTGLDALNLTARVTHHNQVSIDCDGLTDSGNDSDCDPLPPLVPPCNVDPAQDPIAFDCFATATFNAWTAGSATFEAAGDNDAAILTSPSGGHIDKFAGTLGNAEIDLVDKPYFSIER